MLVPVLRYPRMLCGSNQQNWKLQAFNRTPSLTYLTRVERIFWCLAKYDWSVSGALCLAVLLICRFCFIFCQASFFQIQNEKGWSKDRLKPQLYRSSLSPHGVNMAFLLSRKAEILSSPFWNYLQAPYLIFFSNLSSLWASFFPRLKCWSVIAVGKADRGGLTSVQPSQGLSSERHSYKGNEIRNGELLAF